MSNAAHKADKQCTKCGAIKPIDDFYKDGRKKDRRLTACKSCTLSRGKAWYKANQEKHISTTRRWRLANPDKWKEISRENYARDKPRRSARRKAAAQTHPEKKRSQKAVQTAVRLGKLIKPATCSRCDAICNPDGHHWSYEPAHWLDVIWLCRTCHMGLHADEKRNKAQSIQDSADNK